MKMPNLVAMQNRKTGHNQKNLGKHKWKIIAKMQTKREPENVRQEED